MKPEMLVVLSSAVSEFCHFCDIYFTYTCYLFIYWLPNDVISAQNSINIMQSCPLIKKKSRILTKMCLVINVFAKTRHWKVLLLFHFRPDLFKMLSTVHVSTLCSVTVLFYLHSYHLSHHSTGVSQWRGYGYSSRQCICVSGGHHLPSLWLTAG